MTDNITVPLELLRQMQALCMEVRQQSSPRMVALAIPLYDAVKDLLDALAVEPVGYRYKYLNFMGQEVWSFDMPRGQDAKVLETQAVYTAPQAQPLGAQQPAQVAWGVDWGSHGDRSCVSIIKKHADGVHEVVATEYGPVGSAQPAPVQECGYDETTGNCTRNPCCHPNAQQPQRSAVRCAGKAVRKAVKLSDADIESLWPFNKDSSPPYGFAYDIERAVLKANGVEE